MTNIRNTKSAHWRRWLKLRIRRHQAEEVADRRTNQDCAECMRELVDIDYPDVPLIRVVMDNSPPIQLGLYDAFSRTGGSPGGEAASVPPHAETRQLNMVEIEIGVLRSQCLDRRIDDKETILTEVAA